MESITLDLTDRRLAHALQVNGRAPFSQIGEVLGVSDQTVARRYRRMRSAGVLRVVGGTNTSAFGLTQTFLRVRCTPDAASAVAEALGRREDTSWVHMLSGGTEIICLIRAWTPEERDALLLQKLPRTARVTEVTAHTAMHAFMGGQRGWRGLTVLSSEEVERLNPSPVPAITRSVTLEPGDRALLEALARDGRTGYAELAAATGWSESTARRRLETLTAAGALYWDLDVSARTLGYQAESRLWLSVAPSHLEAVGRTMAEHDEVAYCGATTGRSNLMAAVICRDAEDLYRYLTERVGALDGVRDVETAPVIRTVKRAGAML